MLKRKWKVIALVVVLLSLFVGLGAFGWQEGEKIELPLMIRDVVIAVIAENKAGDEIPYEFDYNLTQFYNIGGIYTNSLYLMEQVRIILPFFGYEGITETPTSPDVIGFGYLAGIRSFTVGGFAVQRDTPNPGDPGIILINERYVLLDSYNDKRDILSTLTHELVHHQGANFIGRAPNYLESSAFEANTQAATIEVLAAMCNFRDADSCKAFWDEISAYARGSFRMRLRQWGYENLYYPIADFLWWDDVDRQAADKSLRFWMNDPDRKDYLYNQIYTYQQRPWEYVILPGILGEPLDTGLEGKCAVTTVGIKCEPILMPFDDTTDLIGNFVLWLIRGLK